MKTIQALAAELLNTRWTPEYRERMIHEIPEASIVDRETFIVDSCKGEGVLNLGSNGTDGESQLHQQIKAVAESIYGVDKSKSDFDCDLDENPESMLMSFMAPTLIVAGEILEHLGNPGNLLKTLRRFNCPVIITVPNAFSSSSMKLMHEGIENVNIDHVAWYSWRTLKTLVERYGFSVKRFHWYKGRARIAEGLIMVVE